MAGNNAGGARERQGRVAKVQEDGGDNLGCRRHNDKGARAPSLLQHLREKEREKKKKMRKEEEIGAFDGWRGDDKTPQVDQ